MPLVLLTLGCASTEPSTTPAAPPLPPKVEAVVATTVGFKWGSATPESQGMCGSTLQLGCTTTLQQIWNAISNPIYNTKRFIIIRNDKVIFTRGTASKYPAYSASKGLLGAPTLVYAMSRCGVGLTDAASNWLGQADGARWGSDLPWRDITVEHLASHTSGVCDYDDTRTVCRNEYPGWQSAYDKARAGGTTYVYPRDLFTIARAKSEQNHEPALSPGTAPTCTAGTNWSNNWNVSSDAVNFSTTGPRMKVVEPFQQAFFFPPPFCRMTSVAGTPVDNATDVYSTPADAPTIDLEAEITVNPREGAGSSVPDKVEFYKESDGGVTEYIGNGTLVAGVSPARYALAYGAALHGLVGDARTYFANCIARSAQNSTKKVPSYSQPVRVSRM